MNGLINLDSSLVFQLVKGIPKQEIATVLYEKFKKTSVQSEGGTPMNQKKGSNESTSPSPDSRSFKGQLTKRKSQDPDYPSKQRFVSSLYNLSKAGLVRCKELDSGIIMVERQMYTWV